MDKATPRAIAYVAVQVRINLFIQPLYPPHFNPLQLRFALSSGTSWRLVDIDFSHVEFYSAIIDFFEAPPGPRAQAKADELLAWWNK